MVPYNKFRRLRLESIRQALGLGMNSMLQHSSDLPLQPGKHAQDLISQPAIDLIQSRGTARLSALQCLVYNTKV